MLNCLSCSSSFDTTQLSLFFCGPQVKPFSYKQSNSVYFLRWDGVDVCNTSVWRPVAWVQPFRPSAFGEGNDVSDWWFVCVQSSTFNEHIPKCMLLHKQFNFLWLFLCGEKHKAPPLKGHERCRGHRQTSGICRKSLRFDLHQGQRMKTLNIWNCSLPRSPVKVFFVLLVFLISLRRRR